MLSLLRKTNRASLMRPQKCEFSTCFKNTVVSWSRVIDENFAVKMKTGFRLPLRRTNDTKGMRAITEEDSCPSIAERLSVFDPTWMLMPFGKCR